MSERDLDVVVLGATGVTGRLVAAYLAGRAAATGARWAPAARNRDKLAAMLAEDGVSAPELLVADVSDTASLAALAARTKVVLNLVGPYTLHGRPVIDACVAGGAHYADLTGEIPFVREVNHAVHERAVAAGVKVVQVCGFEALPPDLAVALAAATARERFGEALADVDLHVVLRRPPGMPRPSDALSGGTLQSMAEVTDHADAALILDPAALVDDPVRAQRVRERSPLRLAPRRRADGTIVGPMAPAAFINPAVIQRSAWLRGDGSEPFAYREGIGLGGGTATVGLRYAAAGAMTASQVGLAALVRTSPAMRRRVAAGMRRALPGSGFGPHVDRQEGWWWRVGVEARTTSGREVFAEIDAEGHPGYLATARALGEAGLLLADAGATPSSAGCVTPSVALGTDALARFAAAGLRFSSSVAPVASA